MAVCPRLLAVYVLAGLLGYADAALPACQTDGKHRSRSCIIEGVKSSLAQVQARQVQMPRAVNTILLQEEFDTWDREKASEMESFLKELLAFQYFPHARDTFANHLRGTWGILNAWGQPTDVCRAGLFHTIYGGDLFIFSTLDPFEGASRDRFREIVDHEAEELTWNFGTLARSLVNLTLHSARDATLPMSMSLNSFVEGMERNVSAHDIAKIMVVTIADYLDQLVEISLWRDVHSHEPPSVLYPGAQKPEVALYWISRACRGIRDHLEVIPPIFDSCTKEIAYEQEKEARDLYWEVISEASPLGNNLKIELLRTAALKNPFIAEPHVYLSQLYFQAGDFEECATEARAALSRFYTMGTHWDKRVPYRQWIGHARMLLVRCVRRMEGKTSMPLTSNGVVLTQSLVDEMERLSPIEPALPQHFAAKNKVAVAMGNNNSSMTLGICSDCPPPTLKADISAYAEA